jgi:hypothetical protein
MKTSSGPASVLVTKPIETTSDSFSNPRILTLSETVLGFAAELGKVIDVQPDIDYALPPERLEKLIVGPFRNVGSHSQPIPIVIDALDECKD